MSLEEQIRDIFSHKNRRLSHDDVQSIKKMDVRALSLLIGKSQLDLEADLLFHLKMHMAELEQDNPTFPEAYDEYYIVLSEDKYKTPIALIFPIGRFIYRQDSHNGNVIRAICMNYENHEYVTKNALAQIDKYACDQFHISSLEVRPPLNQKGVGSFLFNHISPIAKSTNAFLDKHQIENDPDAPEWLKRNHRYKAVTGCVAAAEHIISQKDLKEFYSKRGCRFTAYPGIDFKQQSDKSYLYKDI